MNKNKPSRRKSQPGSAWREILSKLEATEVEKLETQKVDRNEYRQEKVGNFSGFKPFEVKMGTLVTGEAMKMRQERAEQTLEDLERIRAEIKDKNLNDESEGAFTKEEVAEAIKENLQKDIEEYLGGAESKTEFVYKLRSFYKSKWGRYTRLAVGSGLTVAGLTSLAVGFLPGAFAALAARVLMSATGSAIAAQELQEGAALHKETSKTEISKSKKIWGFLRRKSIELDSDDIENISVYDARRKLSKMVADAHAIGSDLSDHKQKDAIELLARKSAQIPEHRKKQLIEALNKRLIKKGKKANWNELELMIADRVASNQNLQFNAIESSAKKYQSIAEQNQQERKNRSLKIGAGMGTIAALTGLNKIIHASDSAHFAKDVIDSVKNTINSTLENNKLPEISDVIDNASPNVPSLDNNFVDTNPSVVDLAPSYSAQNSVDYPLGSYDHNYAPSEPAITSNFATTLTKQEADLVRFNTLSSDVVDKAFDSSNDLSAKLNFATKLHRGDLQIVDIVEDVDGKWMTYYEDGKNALGVEVADARYVSVKVDSMGEIIDAKVDTIHEGEFSIPQATPAIEHSPIETPVEMPTQNIESIQEVTPVVEAPHSPEIIQEVNSADTIESVEIDTIPQVDINHSVELEPAMPEKIEAIEMPHVEEPVYEEIPQIDMSENIEHVELETPQVEAPAYESIPEKDFAPIEQNYEEAIPHKSWEEQVVEPQYDTIPQKDMSVEAIDAEPLEESIPTKPF